MQVVACIIGIFIFIEEWYSIIWIYHSVLTCWCVGSLPAGPGERREPGLAQTLWGWVGWWVCHCPKQTHQGQESVKARTHFIVSVFVYIGLRKDVGIFGEVRWCRGWGRVTEGMGWLTWPRKLVYISGSWAKAGLSRLCWVTPVLKWARQVSKLKQRLRLPH